MSEAYSDGYRRGVFDKCNGRGEKSFDGWEENEYNLDVASGYWDGYHSNERRI